MRRRNDPVEHLSACTGPETLHAALCAIFNVLAGPWLEKPGSGQAIHRFVTLRHCGDALTFVPSFTGGSIVIFGP
jgi:hypothetical protein